VLGAWTPEIAPLRPLARELERRRKRGLPVTTLFLDVVGVGPVDAALGAEVALAKVLETTGDRTRLEGCLFVGTAGVYAGRGQRPPATLPLGAPALVRGLHLVSTAALRDEGYWPGPAARELATSPRLTQALAAGAPGMAEADLANTLVITSRAALAKRIRNGLRGDATSAKRVVEKGRPARATGNLPLVENLEAFAVARACARRGVPFAALVGISNVVGADAHATWKEMAPRASEAVARAITTWLLPEGAPFGTKRR